MGVDEGVGDAVTADSSGAHAQTATIKTAPTKVSVRATKNSEVCISPCCPANSPSLIYDSPEKRRNNHKGHKEHKDLMFALRFSLLRAGFRAISLNSFIFFFVSFVLFVVEGFFQ
ncbi:MAG: hypothetical protein JXD18_13665 [Anaerolineae bacterium]|nr:hypothetical protein [Anaerolineae bacterium]